ncbi:hypothetical protein PEDI_41180 [Persicobacter diffluens]|uniref:Uncharacterized protein n=1 Tax=Persicobacter diffluens TaxID=981 RepID=A0AAN5ANQ3_9BACT|nr:hypothetical protein PEDI_41180 [Persicobacter diffluens]
MKLKKILESSKKLLHKDGCLGDKRHTIKFFSLFTFASLMT